MAMPQCCYLAKGAKRPSLTTNTIKFDRIQFNPCNSIKRFDLCPCYQKNSTYLQPLLFILYLLPLRSLPNEFLASYHIYADDITILLDFDLGTTFANFLKHKKIIASFLKLLVAFKLTVNSSKTQCMFVTNQRTRLPETITINGMGIEIKNSVNVLGVTLDNKLGFSSFVNSTCAKS